MAGRNGQNLLEDALRIANAPGRSHPARLSALLRHLAQTLQLASATLFLPNREQTLLSRYIVPDDATLRSCSIRFGDGGAGLCAVSRTRLSLRADDLHPDEPKDPADAQCLFIPMADGGRLAAVLRVGSAEAPLSGSFSRKVKGFLSVLGMVVEGLRLQEHAVRCQRGLPLMSELSKVLNPPLPPTQLLPRLIKACNGSGLCLAAVARLNEGESREPRIFKGCRSEYREEFPLMLASEERLARAALATGLPQMNETRVSELNLHALSLPMSFDGKTMGTFTFFGGGGLVGAEERSLAESVVKLLSSALAEGISSGRISSFFTEKDKKLKELSLLYRMSNTMLSTIKLNKLIHLTLTALTSGPTQFFDRAMLFLTNERSGVLLGMLGVTTESSPPLIWLHGKQGDGLSSRWEISEEEMEAQRDSEFSRQVRGSRLELSDLSNVASRSVAEKRLIFVEDAELEPFTPIELRVASFAVSPLIAHGQVVGVVVVDNALTNRHIAQEDLRFLQLFTNQAGMAIENSILYNKVEESNRQLFEAQEHLTQKERLAAIGEVATGIAHELKGPLVAIGGFASRLSKKLPKDTCEWQNADLIVREVIRLESVLSEILLFAKKATICYARCNVNDIVKESLSVVATTLEEKRIDLSVRLPSMKPILVGDGQQLKQVFINLFLNAIDAMSGGGTLTIRTEPCDLEGAAAVGVKVADTGGGIPLESLNNIFTPFYTTKDRGTGLGLPIANRIVTNHGGKILVHNQPGKGVEFEIVLPLAV